MPVKTRRVLFQKLFEGVGDHELPVDDDGMSVAFAHAERFDDTPVPACGYRTKIMSIYDQILRRGLCGQRPVAGFTMP